jgi:hypothetical protein
MNSKVVVQGAMLLGTNEMITVRRLRITPIKSAKKARMKEEECHS